MLVIEIEISKSKLDLDAKVNLISPSRHCLVDLNLCNVLQMWLVAPESMPQVFEVSVIKLTSTTYDSIIPWTFVAKKFG